MLASEAVIMHDGGIIMNASTAHGTQNHANVTREISHLPIYDMQRTYRGPTSIVPFA